MAILEIHDGKGRVERVEIARDEPCIIGSNPTCTIVINDPAVAPIHGRILWQKRRYKIDAGADVDAIEVNGKRLKKSTLYQGDEIRIGTTRVFVISTEESRVAIPADDKTRIQPAPKVYVPTGRSSTPKSRNEEKSKRKEKPSKPNLFEALDLDEVDILEDGEDLEPVYGSSRARQKPKVSFWQWLKSRILPQNDAPGQERVISSPFVVGLIITFVILVLSSFGLWHTIVKATSQKQFLRAFESLDNGDYRNAIKQLDDFITRFPEDNRSNKARVYRSLAKVRQFTSLTGASWENALQAAQSMVTDVSGLDEYRDASTELAEQLVKTTEGLADRARAIAQQEPLNEAEASLRLLGQVAGNAASSLVGKSRINEKLAAARAAIVKAETRKRALAAMTKAIDSNAAAKAYEARDGLVFKYPDLANDRDILANLIKANELVRKAVQFDPSQRPGESQPHADPLGEPTTLVLRLNPGAPPANSGGIAHAIADGLAFGLDAATGAPLWQVPVGLSCPFPPVPVAGGDPTVLLIDARYDELVRLDQRTGKLLWRQELGERAVDPPLVIGNEIIYALPSGKLLFIDLNNGGVRGSLNLGRPINRTPVSDEVGAHLYVLANQDCLFVINRDPISCVGVEYLGHAPGSIPASPTRVGRFFVVPENISLTDGRWQVFVLDEAGVKLSLRQTIPVAGWIWQSPATSGSVFWSVSDRGEIVAQSIGLYESDQPLRPIAVIPADNTASGPAFAIARSERELWLTSSRPARFDLNSETGKLGRVWGLSQIGPALAPLQVVDKLAIFTQQSVDSPGVALTGVDPQSGVIAWRTTLGAPWPVEFTAVGNGAIETLGFTGSKLTIAADTLAKGGFIEQPLSKPGTFRVPSQGASWLRCGETTVMIPEPRANHILARKGDAAYKRFELPAPLGASPIAWGKDVLIPGSDGRIYLIDPATGEFAADPFVPRFDKSRPSQWLSPVLVDGDSVILAERDGLIRRLVKTDKPRPKLSVTGESRLGKPISGEIATTGASIVIATSDNKLRTLATRDLSPVGSVDLTGLRSVGPIAVGEFVFCGDSAGGVAAFGKDGRRIWQSTLRSPMTDAPAIHNGAAWFLTRAGAIESRKMSDGLPAERLMLGVLPAGPPQPAGNLLVIPAGLGSMRPVAAIRPEGKAAP